MDWPRIYKILFSCTIVRRSVSIGDLAPRTYDMGSVHEVAMPHMQRSYLRREQNESHPLLGFSGLRSTTAKLHSQWVSGSDSEPEEVRTSLDSLGSGANQFVQAVESANHLKDLIAAVPWTNPDCLLKLPNLSHADPNGCILSDSDLQKIEPTGNYSRLIPLMKKLEAGDEATLLILGGSMTAGGGCGCQDAQGFDEYYCRDAAWAARFGRWLQQKYPHAKIHVENRAIPGAIADVHLGLLGITLASLRYDIDLAIIDTSVNGGSSEAIESLVRSLHKLGHSKTRVFGVVTTPSADPSEMAIFERYGVPRLNFAELVRRNPRLWVPTPVIQEEARLIVWQTHPGWQTHQAIAEVLAHTWQTTVERKDELEARAILLDPLWQQINSLPPMFPDVNKVSFCEKPLTLFSAKTQALPGPMPDGWRLFEDKKSKPGFITQTKNSAWQFPLQFGNRPSFGISYLKTYNDTGTVHAQLSFGPQSNAIWGIDLTSLWDKNLSETVMWQKDLPGDFQNKTAYFTISLVDGAKFKFTDIMSC